MVALSDSLRLSFAFRRRARSGGGRAFRALAFSTLAAATTQPSSAVAGHLQRNGSVTVLDSEKWLPCRLKRTFADAVVLRRAGVARSVRHRRLPQAASRCGRWSRQPCSGVLAPSSKSIPAERRARLTHAVAGPQIRLVVFHRARQPLVKVVVPPGAAATLAVSAAVLWRGRSSLRTQRASLAERPGQNPSPASASRSSLTPVSDRSRARPHRQQDAPSRP